MNKYNIFADPLCFEIKNRRQGPKTAGYFKPWVVFKCSYLDIDFILFVNLVALRRAGFFCCL
jgi:hypothetical protein